MKTAISFLRRGEVVHLQPEHPTLTVLDYLRLHEKLKGTKEGCNEGDCGACTVAVGRLKNNKLVYEPANACILFVGQLQGCELITVDDLAQDSVLHPVQQAMVTHHASQCGFCTPGFVMSLFTLYHQGQRPTRQDIVDHLAGNLCRCTGYRPIIDAAQACCTGVAADLWAGNEATTITKLHSINALADVFIETSTGFIAIPTSTQALSALVQQHPDATIVSGATDVGLWATKQMRVLPKIIHTFNVADLHEITNTDGKLEIGSAATYAEAFEALAALSPAIGEVVRRIGSKHVRATGTIGGNIANGSPIGDMPPLLIALGATLQLRQGEATRALPLEEFFIDYGKQDRKPGEWVWRIDVPKLHANEVFHAHKISKRFDQDISALLFAMKARIENDRIVDVKVAMGGMAATPKRALKTEHQLLTISLQDEASWAAALDALQLDFQPISDMRASAHYRIDTARALLKKTLLELSGQASSMDVLQSQGTIA